MKGRASIHKPIDWMYMNSCTPSMAISSIVIDWMQKTTVPVRGEHSTSPTARTVPRTCLREYTRYGNSTESYIYFVVGLIIVYLVGLCDAPYFYRGILRKRVTQTITYISKLPSQQQDHAASRVDSLTTRVSAVV